MSDFSDLCPLFNTGVYKEIMVPYIDVSGGTTSICMCAFPPFGRSVIVTDFYAAKLTAFASTCTAVKIKLYRAATAGGTMASGTAFASLTLSGSATVQALNKYLTGTTTDTTFSATQILKLGKTKDEAGAKHVAVIIRYKEK